MKTKGSYNESLLIRIKQGVDRLLGNGKISRHFRPRREET